MNKILKVFSFAALATLLVCSASMAQSTQTTKTKKSTAQPNKQASKKPAANAYVPSASDEFFMISSVDKAHNALILLRPTQITATVVVNDKTQFADENGKPLKLSDLRTGDTVFASIATQAGGVLTATHVREGMMTMAEMRKRYLPGLPVVTSPAGLGH